jgi:hypothetical protein
MRLFSKTVKQQAMTADLAGQVQQLLLPKSPPVCDWSCIGVRNRMAEDLGGDFFDFLPTADGCQAVMIGDVVGHGPSAAVVMGLLYGYIHSKLQAVCSVHQVVDQVNAFLKSFAARSQTHDHLFSTTLFFGIIDPLSLKLDYVNAGHPPALVRRGGEILALHSTTQPLGFFDVPENSVRTILFQKHDRWLLYTDGITGPMTGARLKALPSALTTWQKWHKQHPQTEVLSIDTGYSRDYTQDPYADYYVNRKGFFSFFKPGPGEEEKALVAGITMDGTARAYPLDLLRQKKALTDSLNGTALTVDFTPESDQIRIRTADDEEITPLILYWFVWKGMYPESDLFKGNSN